MLTLLNQVEYADHIVKEATIVNLSPAIYQVKQTSTGEVSIMATIPRNCILHNSEIEFFESRGFLFSHAYANESKEMVAQYRLPKSYNP